MTFKAQIKAAIGWDWNEGLRDNGRLEYAKGLAIGNSDNQADAAWHAEHELLALGAAVTYDLSSLDRLILGTTHRVSFAAVKAILIVNESTDGGELLVGGASTDRWSEPFGATADGVVVPADGAVLFSSRQNGWPVDEMARNLRVAASGGDVTYSIAIVGALSLGEPASGSGE